MQIRIAILANKDLSKLSKKIAKDLSKQSKSFFWVDGKKLAHHATLFDIFVNGKELAQAGNLVDGFVCEEPKLLLKINNLWRSPSGRGYVGFQIKQTKELISFRRRLFKKLKKFKPESSSNTYNAHITLTRYKDFGFADKVQLKNKIKKIFKFNKIIFVKTDKHGQVIKILREFKLK